MAKLPKCNICGNLLVNIYAKDTSDSNKPYEAIGKICFSCDHAREFTEFFVKSKSKAIAKAKARKEKMRRFTAGKVFCPYCRAKGKIITKLTKKKIPAKIRRIKDQYGNILEREEENAHYSYKCSSCKRIHTVSILSSG